MGNYSIRVFLSDSKTKENFDVLESVCSFKIQMMKNVRQDYPWRKGSCKYIEQSIWKVQKNLDNASQN